MVGKTATASAGMTIGHYELVCKLSDSAYGTLWAARPTGDGDEQDTVALRYLDTSLAGGSDTTSEIASVARAATVVEHDHLVPIIEAIEEGTTLGVVSTFVEGETLGSLLRVASVRRSPIPRAVALRIATDVLETLSLVHDKGKALGKHSACAYGGVGPGTIMVGVDGQARLLEFGLAGFAARVEAWAGDPKRVAYLSPEALADKPDIGAAADGFSLGVFLWEMLQNKRLFGGLSHAAVAKKVKEQTIGRVDAGRSPDAEAISKPLADFVARCLERDRDERFATAAEMLAALGELDDEVASREQVAATVEKLAGRVIASHRTAIEKYAHTPAPKPVLSKPPPAAPAAKEAPTPGAKKPPPAKKKAPPVPPDKKGTKPSPPKPRKPPSPPTRPKPKAPAVEPPTEEIDLEEELDDEAPASERPDSDEAAASGPPSEDEPEGDEPEGDEPEEDEPEEDEPEEDDDDEDDNRLTLPFDDIAPGATDDEDDDAETEERDVEPEEEDEEPEEEDEEPEEEDDEEPDSEPERPAAAAKPLAPRAAEPPGKDLAADLDEPEQPRSKLGLLLAGAAVVVIVIVALSMMGDGDETVAEPATTTTAAAETRSAEPEPTASEPEAPEDAGSEAPDAEPTATAQVPTPPAPKTGPGSVPTYRPPPPRTTKPPAPKPPDRYLPGDL